MVQEVEQALRLQEFDKQITGLTAEIAALPKHVAVIEKQLESHLRKLEANRAALAANQRERSPGLREGASFAFEGPPALARTASIRASNCFGRPRPDQRERSVA